MARVNGEFILSNEQELMTVVQGTADPVSVLQAVHRLIQTLAALAPSLPSAGDGIFNPYGRVYLDCGGHLELAAIECESPYILAEMNERQHWLVSRAVQRLADEGLSLLLAGNNHSALLQAATSVWGAHENYLVEHLPEEFAEEILPFLVTRFFAGAGGVHYPVGDFLAAVRPLFMRRDTGGGTTRERAIHSTARDEHHMGPSPQRYRYHLILGDGHRSHFNLALQFGATALALKAIFFDKKLPGELDGAVDSSMKRSWLRTLRHFNRLARPGRPLTVHPKALKIQRVYLGAASRYAASLAQPPSWIPRLLRDWEETLDAAERMDRAWLAARLDGFAKYELYSTFLRQAGSSWKDLRGNDRLFYELALLDHSYHEFSAPSSVFLRLERAHLLEHRVGETITPGCEADPHVPETITRANARARFIRESTSSKHFIMDWTWVEDLQTRRRRRLYEPFAREYGPWHGYGRPRPRRQ